LKIKIDGISISKTYDEDRLMKKIDMHLQSMMVFAISARITSGGRVMQQNTFSSDEWLQVGGE